VQSPAVRRALLILLIAGAITRLPGLASPPVVVFDEVHWGKAVNAYCCTGERIFDVHPPHGKLLLTLGAVLTGYEGGVSFDSIGLPYQAHPAWGFRLLPALVGIAIPLIFFAFLLALGGSLPAAFMGGALLLLDNALLLETHVLLFDGILVAAILGTLTCVLHVETAASPKTARYWRLAAGALAGLAVGTKFTGLVAPGLIAIWLLTRWRSGGPQRARVLASGLEIAVAGVLMYLAGWVVHFSLLTNPGLADAFHPTTGRFIEDLQVTHRVMFEANANMRTPHPDASVPLSWPWMKVAPFFWAGPSASIHLVGNPVVWWGSAVLLMTMLVNMVLMRVTRLRVEPLAGNRVQLWLPLAGFAVAFLPFFGVERVLFLYHYLTPLVFAVAAVLLWLDRAGWIRSANVGDQRRSYYVVLALAVLGFLAISPVTYGFSVDQYDEWLVGLLRSWR
jgi:dolichyl-phosphate-mannose--protein O-mannosyl transferase